MTDNTDIVEAEFVESNDQTSKAIQIRQMDVEYALEVYHKTVKFWQNVLKEGSDYGTIPGTNKPTLYKAGAEKFHRFFGFSASIKRTSAAEQWDVPISLTTFPVFSYTYETTLTDQAGNLVVTCEGNTNSYEDKYRWRWVYKKALGEFAAVIDQLETRDSRSGTQYKIPNTNIYTQINTLMKISQKRSYVGAVMIGANATEFFTQDMEDMSGLDTDAAHIRNLVPRTQPAKELVMKWTHDHLDVEKPGPLVKSVLDEHEVEFPNLDLFHDILDWCEEAAKKK